ncbi:MAG: hypothetical protein L6R48_00420, partial [Planctomycetes bacterium]|nr:hypothetical protein [Planctomycetota bacterium]
AAEGAFDWLRIVPGADAAALAAASAAPAAGPAAAAAEGAGPLSPAAPDAEEARRWDLSGAARERTASGDRICLNGTWRFLPAPAPGQRPPAGRPWLRTRLPGRWLSGPLFPVWDAAGAVVTEVDGRLLARTFDAWLVRRVRVPADFRGERLLLTCDLVAADRARFLRDGVEMGGFHAAGPAERAAVGRCEVDLGPVVPGAEFELAVELGFRPYTDKWTATDASLVDLALEGRGARRTVAALVRPDATGDAEALLTVANPDGRPGSVAAAVRLLDAKGIVLREIPAGRVVFAAGERERELRLALPWDGLRRWSPEDPALYHQQAVLRGEGGAVVDETFPRTCALRRFSLERDGFHLDGVRRRLIYDSDAAMLWSRYALACALDPALVRAQLSELKAIGFNTVNLDIDWEGAGSLGRTPYHVEKVLAAADELGLLVVLTAPPLERGDDPQAHRRLVRGFVRAWGHHPSVALYMATFNTCWYPLGQHPQAPMRMDYMPPGKDDARARALACEAALHAEDPARPVYHNASGNLTQLFTTMHYLSMGMPLQERADWPAAWSAARPNVLFPSELGLPYFEQFKDFDFPERNHGPLLTVEHAARFLGDAAYALVRTPSLRDTVIAQPHDGDAARPEVMAVKELVARRTLDAWRAWDVPAIGLFGEKTFTHLADHQTRRSPLRWDEDRTWGIKPALLHLEHRRPLVDRPTPYRDALRLVLAPVSVQLGGPAGPADQVHAWFAGEALAKEAVVVNDGPVVLALTLSARLLDRAGRELAAWDAAATVAAGEVLRRPFALPVPAVAGRTDAVLRLQALGDDRRLLGSAELAVTLFPAHRPPGDLGVAVALRDPLGRTAALLRRAGVPFSTADDLAAVRAARVLVVGEGALGDRPDPVLAEAERSGLIEQGLTVVVLAQGPSLCANLVHLPSRQRTAFVRERGHAVLAGLEDADLHDWRGPSAMAAATSPATREMETTPHYPHVKYLVTDTGMVAPWTLLKPDRGGFRVLADAGFDQREALLLEQRRGAGRVLLCQFELVARYGLDPAATLLADNLLRWAAAPAPAAAPARRAVLAGDGAWADEIAALFPALERRPAAAIPAEADLLVLAPAAADPVWQEAGRAALARGAAVVWLHPGGSADLGGLAPGVSAAAVEAWRALPGTGLPAGIAPAELHWRDPRPLAAFRGVQPWCEPAVLAAGGRLTLVGLPPAAFVPRPYQLTSGKPYTSFIDIEQRRKPLRVVERILTAMGAVPAAQPLFTGVQGEDGTLGGLRAVIDLPRWRFSTDPAGRGEAAGWAAAGFDDGGWRWLQAGLSWEQQGVADPAAPSHRYHDPAMGPAGGRYAPYDGHAWYRCAATIPEAWRDGEVRLVLGTVDDTDRTFLDGALVGETGSGTPRHWEARREYLLPPERIRFGQPQVFAIQVHDNHGEGGLRKLPVRLEVAPRGAGAASPYVPWRPGYDPDAYHNW